MSRRTLRPRALTGSAALVLTVACGEPRGPVSVEPAALHRLTSSQIDRSLAVLFGSDALSPVSLPQEIPSDGFSNQAVMRDATPFLVEALERSISRIVDEAIDEGGGWLSCHPELGDEAESCGREVLTAFLPRAWRRPATADDEAWIGSAFASWNEQVGFDGALRLALTAVLLSPDFLYLTEVGDPATERSGVRRLTDWELASRLSYFLWNAPPDDELRELAQSGRLGNHAVLEAQAMRMLRDARAREAVLEFHRQWLGAAYITKIDPDYEALGSVVLSDGEREYFDYINAEGTVQEFIELDELWGYIKREIKISYEAEFAMFVNRVVFGTGTLHDLLTSRVGFVSTRTAPFYGVEPDGEAIYYTSPTLEGDFEAFSIDMYEVQLPPAQRAGILTQGAFLAGHSHPNQPSPVLRGVFLRERLLCIEPSAPPGDIPAISATNGGDWTTNRERFAQHTSDPSCAGCHVAIDGVGFPFENYDAVGAWRDTDNGAPVDATGELLHTDMDGAVANAIELIDRLSTSRQTHDCMVEQLYQYAMHRAPESGDEEHLADLREAFWSDGGTIPNLYLRIVTHPSFSTIPVPEGEAS